MLEGELLQRLAPACLCHPAPAPSHSTAGCLACAGLVELEVRRCGLERLPPGLSAATALTRLTLDVNKDLALSYGEADVLRRLPRLRALQAQYTTTPPRVAAHLHVLAPCLEAVWSLGQAFHRWAAMRRMGRSRQR